MIKSPIALGTVRTSLVLGLRLLTQAATLLLVARVLGPQHFGVFVGAASMAVLLGALSAFGTHLVLLGEMSKDPSSRDHILSYAIPTTLLCGGTLLVFYQALASWVLPTDAISWQPIFAIGLTEILLQPLFGLMATEHHALGRIARAQLMRNSPLALRLFTASCIFLFDLSPALDIYAWGYLAASACLLFLGAVYLPKKLPSYFFWRLPTFVEIRHAFGYAAISASKTGPAELDKTLAIKLLSVDVAGIYAAGARVVAAVTLPVTAMTLSALPRLFRQAAEPVMSSRFLLQSMYWISLFYSLMLSGALWLSAPMLEGVFGAKYQGMCEVIRWLCLAIPGNAFRLVGGNVLMAMGRPWYRVGFEVAGLSMLTLAAFFLVPSLDIKGMVLSVVLAEWVMAITSGIIIIKINKNRGHCRGGR